MPNDTVQAAATGLPDILGVNAHRVALALDEYLALTSGPFVVDCHDIMRTPAEAFAVADEEFAFYNLLDGNVPPAVRALSRLRFEAACEVERLLRLLDALDGDHDLENGFDQEAVCEDEGAQCEDEGCPDDNGLGDTGGKNEQGFA